MRPGLEPGRGALTDETESLSLPTVFIELPVTAGTAGWSDTLEAARPDPGRALCLRLS